MTRPTIPETYVAKDWPRKVKGAFDWLGRALDVLTGRVAAAEAGIGTLQTDVTAAEGNIAALVGRVTALEGATAYTAETVTYTLIAEPGSPVAGMTYFDSGTNKLRTYDGTIWQDHW